MEFKKITILLTLLLISCSKVKKLEIDGPAALSHDQNIAVEQWEYISQAQFTQLDDFVFPAKGEGIVFGVEPQTAQIIWTEVGFDLYWGEFPCATKPIVIIQENLVIELFAGKQPALPIECEAMKVGHKFSLILSSSQPIPVAGEWNYRFKSFYPP